MIRFFAQASFVSIIQVLPFVHSVFIYTVYRAGLKSMQLHWVPRLWGPTMWWVGCFCICAPPSATLYGSHLIVTSAIVDPVACAENFLGGRGSFSGRWWSFVFDVRCLWRHNL